YGTVPLALSASKGAPLLLMLTRRKISLISWRFNWSTLLLVGRYRASAVGTMTLWARITATMATSVTRRVICFDLLAVLFGTMVFKEHRQQVEANDTSGDT